ncbi:MAG TPA: AzlD domain-containing protein [Solirubrobacterales bacterium]|nr:AzlD domain-containing protein [Solirubrobacterales bacterium]
MAEAWIVVGALVVTTVVIRASGPVLLGGRELPAPARSVIALLAAALLAALVVTETFRGEGSELTLDERALGIAAAGAVLVLRGHVLLAIGVAMAVTAGARALL